VIASIENDNGRIVEDRRTVEERRRVITPDIAKAMVAMLTRVCIDGTGRECKLDDWQALGKTGTAQIPHNDEARSGYEPQAYLASFIAAAPVSHPQLAVLIMTRHPRKNGYYGSAVSLPAVKETLNFAMNYLDVPHEPGQSGTEAEE
jgi:cell division protein FtsI/penicillin-binding protein 2